MKSSRVMITVLAVLALAAVGYVWQKKIANADSIKLEVGPPAPAWKLMDLAGQPVSSEQFKGKIVVLDFWATWCPPCVAEIPGYIELQKKYGPQGLVIVGVSLDQQGPGHVKKFAESKGMNYPLVMGDDEVAAAFGGIEAIPTTFLINRAGQIVHQKQGAMAHAEYEKLVVQALK